MDVTNLEIGYYQNKMSGVGIKTTALLVTLCIFDGHPVRIKCAGSLFQFHLLIPLVVI